MNNARKYSVDEVMVQNPYVSPKIKVIEVTAENAILESSPGSTLEDGNPVYPGW